LQGSYTEAKERSPMDNKEDNLMFVDPCIIVQFIQKNPTRCNSVSKFDMYMSYRSFVLKIQLTVTHDIITVWTAVCYVYHVT